MSDWQDLTIHIKHGHQWWPAMAGFFAGFTLCMFLSAAAMTSIEGDRISAGGFFRDGVRYSIEVAR